jgi:hypothetical protein
VARLSYLSDVGEDDFETALDMVARIVERHSDVALA